MGRGWGGGDDGVGTARSAVGAARLYNLRLPPKASGKDTGWAWGRRPDLRATPMPPTPHPRHDAAPRKRTWAEDEHTPEHSPRQQETPAMLAYKCPHCQATVRSTVSDGTVHVRGHCGRQFRVRKGVVSRLNSISCPTCGTRVLSTRTRGQIQGKHTKPNGKACPTTRWYVK